PASIPSLEEGDLRPFDRKEERRVEERPHRNAEATVTTGHRLHCRVKSGSSEPYGRMALRPAMPPRQHRHAFERGLGPASTTSACQGPAASDGTGAARASSITTTAVRRRRRDAGSIALFPQIRSLARRRAIATGPYQGVPVEAHVRPITPSSAPESLGPHRS